MFSDQESVYARVVGDKPWWLEGRLQDALSDSPEGSACCEYFTVALLVIMH